MATPGSKPSLTPDPLTHQLPHSMLIAPISQVSAEVQRDSLGGPGSQWEEAAALGFEPRALPLRSLWFQKPGEHTQRVCGPSDWDEASQQNFYIDFENEII